MMKEAAWYSRPVPRLCQHPRRGGVSRPRDVRGRCGSVCVVCGVCMCVCVLCVVCDVCVGGVCVCVVCVCVHV